MQFRTINFNVEELCFQKVSHRFDPHRNVYVDTYSAKFVRGQQVRTEVKDIINYTYHDEPVDNIDYLKTWIVKTFPSLNFGWLKPNIKQVKQTVVQPCESTYYNIMPYPVQIEAKDYTRTHLQMYERLQGQDTFDECDFLLSEPCTQKEIQVAKDDKYMRGQEFALFYA